MRSARHRPLWLRALGVVLGAAIAAGISAGGTYAIIAGMQKLLEDRPWNSR